MGWLTNWDDLIHGTAVFGAAVPFVIAFLVARFFRQRVWVALPVGLIVTLLWLFGLPSLPPKTSDQTLVPAWGIALLLILAEGRLKSHLRAWLSPLLRIPAWSALAWSIYPAWLAADGGQTKQLIVALTVGVTITVWSMLIGYLNRDPEPADKPRFRLTPISLVPPTIALSVLLQFGGSTQFSQTAGALCSTLAAISIVYLWKPKLSGLGPATAFAAMLFGILAWSGWLFAEIHVTAAACLPLAPLAALAANVFSHGKETRTRLWEGLCSAGVSILIVWAGWARYSDGQDTMGY